MDETLRALDRAIAKLTVTREAMALCPPEERTRGQQLLHNSAILGVSNDLLYLSGFLDAARRAVAGQEGACRQEAGQ